ncbi:MAG: helix-turn-helix transcriptional regulator [Butyricicoccus sp.]|nr:helix-turn-helix transcriptional regulator [Butyricicoccus sp.]
MLGERIRRLRTGARMKQSDLAQRLEISTSAVGMYEQGRREPPYHVLLKLSELFGVSVDWLLAREESAAPAQSDDFSDMLSAFHQQLRQQEGLMFHGRPLSESDLEKIMRAMRLGAELSIREEQEDPLP